MRRPAQIKPWLSEEELLAWLRDSPDSRQLPTAFGNLADLD